jgi:hypothetical protein
MAATDAPAPLDLPSESQHFALHGRTWGSGDAGFQAALARAHATGDRPRCLCTSIGTEMYVALHQRYLVKRMPQTGDRHHPTCPSYAPDGQLSGLGPLVGDAVVEHGPDQVELRVDFPWMRLPSGRAPPPASPGDPGEVAGPRGRMSLRAVLHYLFERAGFNRWTPAMAGRRNQAVLHKYLMEAAAGIAIKGVSLAERLVVPEPFSQARKEELAAQRRERLAITQPQDGRVPLALVVGDFKSCEPGALGQRLWVRHMPDTPLRVGPACWSRMVRAYGALLEAHDADAGRRVRLVLAALVHARQPGVYEIDTACLMLTSRDWIPLDAWHELPLVEALVAQQRRFFKPLRYDAHSAAPFANALLLDAGPVPVPLHMLSAYMSPRDRLLKDEAVREAANRAWVWVAEGPLPALPARGTMRAAPAKAAMA